MGDVSHAPRDGKNYIIVRGAKEHNLKGVNLEIPKNQLVVFTGLSGSGKSSMAFDTLYAEGQRRYVESLSSYARQFLGLMKKPEVEHIEGLSPAISIDQKTTSHNPRSTVGTITEIYDYLRLLYARVGHASCPNCGREVATQSIDQMVDIVWEQIRQRTSAAPARLMILSPVIRDKKGEFHTLFERLIKQGYTTFRIDKKFEKNPDKIALIKTNRHNVDVTIRRMTIAKIQIKDELESQRLRTELAAGLEEALKLADGFAGVSFIQDASFNFPEIPEKFDDFLFSEKLACSHCGISLKELEPRLFSFNAPQGACPTCNGLGAILKIDEKKIIAPALSLSEGAIIPFARTLSTDTWWARLLKTVIEDCGYDYRTTAYENFDEATRKTILYGSGKIYRVEGENRFGAQTTIEEKFEGVITNLERRYSETESEFMRNEIGAYMLKTVCPDCQGRRLNSDALSVHIDAQNIAQITALPITQALAWVDHLNSDQILSNREKIIAAPIIKEVGDRLQFLVSVGLNYLTLDREASTLAGGEAQRIRLASQIGTGLTGVLYILDEPTIGLHQRDNDRLIETLKNLRDKGNSVIVVEHDYDVIAHSDYVFDFGPGAGKKGGEVVAQGTPVEITSNTQSLTGDYLSGRKQVKRPKIKLTNRKLVDLESAPVQEEILIQGASHHNLKSIDVAIPLNKLVCITGVSGSGKSTLLHDTLYYQLLKHFGRVYEENPGEVERIMIPDLVKRVVLIDQKPIGKTPRSNPATYSKAFDYVRELFANTKEARLRGFGPGRFSFNTKGGRCEACQGDGQTKIEMQFLPDVYVTCDVCGGKRYNQETLSVEYKGLNIADVLNLTVDEALKVFEFHSGLNKKLGTLAQVGLGYITLGQPAPTLSGGEAQRLKLAKELATQNQDHNIYLLDEPTTGLHFADVAKLLGVLSELVAHNNTVVVIEHNLDIIKNADWLIDLGPEGGEGGGNIVFTGTPESAISQADSLTGQYLKSYAEQFKS